MSDLDELLRAIYRRCDVSNNMVDALGEDEAIESIKRVFDYTVEQHFVSMHQHLKELEDELIDRPELSQQLPQTDSQDEAGENA